MMNRYVLGACSFSLMALTAACGGSDMDLTGFSVRAMTRSPGDTLIMTDSGRSNFIISEAWLHLRGIELSLPDGTLCADAQLAGNAQCESDTEDKIVIPGPFVIDLVTGTSTPDLSDIGIPPGLYRRIDFRVEDGDPEDGLIQPGDILDGRSYVVRAGFAYQNTLTTLELSLAFSEDIRIEQAVGLEVTVEQDLLAELAVNDWLKGVDIGACLERGDLTIQDNKVLVDENSTAGECSDIENTIKENMKTSGQLGRR